MLQADKKANQPIGSLEKTDPRQHSAVQTVEYLFTELTDNDAPID
ncbi:hypothetical protein ACFPMF_08815 [Larkinella bovis]|uniref:Uncharacterized protein n=1 Tax=Larkinella bovis TaxID=683041 RepID=A0ABW0I7E3_9BACT